MKLKKITGILAGLFATAILLFLIKLFVFEILYISGASMEPSVKDGTYVFFGKLHYGLNRPFGDDLIVQWKEPKAGDIVIYLYDNKLVIKRCVAVAGDTLEICAGSGYNLLVNSKKIPLTEIQYHLMQNSTIVPDGTILCIGDNMEKSIDSRNYGFVPVKNILGKVLVND